MTKAILAFNGAVLLGCAIFFSAFDFSKNSALITILLLFLPFLDKSWHAHILEIKILKNMPSFVLLLIFISYLILLFLQPDKLILAVSIIFLIALPEEWFFRYYFLHQLDSGGGWSPWINNIVCSLLFTGLHFVTQGLSGLMVFFPSLVFGYIYQQSKNLLIVALLHGISNLFYVMYLKGFL